MVVHVYLSEEIKMGVRAGYCTADGRGTIKLHFSEDLSGIISKKWNDARPENANDAMRALVLR